MWVESYKQEDGTCYMMKQWQWEKSAQAMAVCDWSERPLCKSRNEVGETVGEH